MKHFIICSLLAFIMPMDAAACTPEGPTHNHYMFSIYRREAMEGPAYLADIDRLWRLYTGAPATGGSTDYYKWNREEVAKVAARKGDKAMTSYLKQLNRYLDVCAYMAETWDYPSKKEVAQRRQTTLAVLAAARAYRGTQLRPQYTLLQMRANMLLGQHANNIALWRSTASKLPSSAWREAMRNIYARALLKTGKRQAACNIYAEQGDMQSIKALMRNYRNLAGIKNIFAQDPNSPTLQFLVQDFVNNVQETVDLKPQNLDDEEWLKEIDAKAVYQDEALRFAAFANNVALAGKSKSPSMWLAAAAMVHYLLGHQQEAEAEAEKASAADGTTRMKDNARAIKLLVSTRSGNNGDAYMDYVLREFNWLDSKIKAERGAADNYDNHYTDVKDRVVHRGLEPMLRKLGNDNMALALCAMMDCEENNFMASRLDADKNYDYNLTYSPWSEYFEKLDSLNADRLIQYYGYITSAHKHKLDDYVSSHTYRNTDYFNDLIGTKLMAEGRFADALNYLEKVPLAFISKQLIREYAAKRSYDVERWFKRQPMEETGNPVKLTANKKVEFCKDMLQLQSKYNIARDGAPREAAAYDLAVRYFQASCYGDCWWLTHYYHSVTDSARTWETDFCKSAISLLNVCRQSKNAKTRYKALYALAFIPTDSWFDTAYDNDYNMLYVVRPVARQYKALSELAAFKKSNPADIDNYAARCDMLRRFEEECNTATFK